MPFSTFLFGAPLVVLSLLVPITTAPSEPAAVHRAVARFELEVLRNNLRYVGRMSRLEAPERREQSREALVQASTAIIDGFRPVPAALGQLPLGATAQRLARAVLAVQQNEYKHVNELSRYRINSPEAMQLFCQANSAAQHRVVVLIDSLENARQEYATEYGLRQEITRQVEMWAQATRQVDNLYQYFPQVLLPYMRVRLAVEPLRTAVLAHDVPGFEQARRRLAEETTRATADLAHVSDFMNLDVAFRSAGRAFVAQQAACATGPLAQASALLKRLKDLSGAEQQTVDTLLSDYFHQNEALDAAFNKAGDDFMKTNAPSFDIDAH